MDLKHLDLIYMFFLWIIFELLFLIFTILNPIINHLIK
jgi:hypothetical protein